MADSLDLGGLGWFKFQSPAADDVHVDQGAPTSNILYMARQPILDAAEETVGYELLYRATAESRANFSDSNTASHNVLEQTLLLGCRELSGGKRLYINCTGELLVNDYVSVLPPENIVVEVLENVEPTTEVVEACKRLKHAGFTIALDDFQPTPLSLPLLPYADIIKVDFRNTPENMRREIVQRYCRRARALAEKVETRAEFESARACGFGLFQGYFFCQPVLLANQHLLPLRVNHLRLMEKTCADPMNFSEVERIIKDDPALCYRLLRYLNSYVFCLRAKITSIRHALTLLGEHQVKRWVAVACVTSAAQGTAPSTLNSALLRAHLGESLAACANCRPYDLFIVGLFSVMDAFLGAPLSQILSQVALPPECSAALLGQPNRLRQVLDLVIAYERGKWTASLDACARLGLNGQNLIDNYVRSVLWVDNIMSLAGQDLAMEAAPPVWPAEFSKGNGLQVN